MRNPTLSPTSRATRAAVAVVSLIVLLCACSTPPPPVQKPAAGATSAGSSTTPPTQAVAAAISTLSPVAPSEPSKIEIPSIGVAASLMGLGLKGDGSMQVPPAGFPAGWYTGSPTPGQLGPSIVAGHVDWDGKPGVFFRLRALKPGAQVVITRLDGSVVTFTVTGNESYPKSRFPTSTVYGDIDHAGLRLITCGGLFDDAASSYYDNIVAYADLTGYRAA